MEKNCDKLFESIKKIDRIGDLNILKNLALKYYRSKNPPLIFDKNNKITFKNLEDYLKEKLNNYNTIGEFIKEFSFEYQQNFEPQESIFRLFAIRGLLSVVFEIENSEQRLRNVLSDCNDLEDINEFGTQNNKKPIKINLSKCELTFQNYGKGEVETQKGVENQPFEKKLETEKRMGTVLKDSGDISDLTFIDHINKKVIVVTSKNYKDYCGKGKKFDLATIKNVWQKEYVEKGKSNGYSLLTVILVRDKNEVKSAIKRMTFSSKLSKELVENSHLIDWDDLNRAYRKFKYDKDIPLHMNLIPDCSDKCKRIITTEPGPKTCKGTWTLIDENKCKNLDENSNLELIKKLVPQMNNNIFNSYTLSEIREYYNQFNDVEFIQLLDETLDEKLDNQLTCLFGKKEFVNESLNIVIETGKRNILQSIIYPDIEISIICDQDDKEIITDKIKNIQVNPQIFIDENLIKKSDVVINLTRNPHRHLENFYKKLIHKNRCRYIIDSEFYKTRLKKWGVERLWTYELTGENRRITFKIADI